MTTIAEYELALAKAEGLELPEAGPMRWLYEEGKSPMAFHKARGFPKLATQLPGSQILVSVTTSADHKLAAGFFEFFVFCLEDWQAAMGTRGLDVMTFTVPRRFLQICPGVFEAMFAECAATIPTIWGHGGLGVNLPPLEIEANEASEYFLCRRYGPGIDVGEPASTSIRDLMGKIKTVDWLTALDADLVRQVGGADTLMLPPDWFRKTPFGNAGLVIQAGPEPAAGVPMGKGIPPGAPAAYVLLNHALRSIVAESSDILQGGTVDSTAPLLNTRVATEAWLRRFDVPDEEINGYWVELHKTPKLSPVAR